MKLSSHITPSQDGFKANRFAHLEAIELIQSVAQSAALGGGEKSRARHLSRGKLLPRDRVAGLLE